MTTTTCHSSGADLLFFHSASHQARAAGWSRDQPACYWNGRKEQAKNDIPGCTDCPADTSITAGLCFLPQGNKNFRCVYNHSWVMCQQAYLLVAWRWLVSTPAVKLILGNLPLDHLFYWPHCMCILSCNNLYNNVLYNLAQLAVIN